MAIPNIAAVATINNKTTTLDLTTTSATVLLSNASASGESILITSLYLANVDGSSAVAATVSHHDAAAGGGSAIKLGSTVSVPANATLVFIDKNSPITLEEDTSLTITAGAANDLQAVCSYTVLS